MGEGATFSGSMSMGGPTQVAAQGIRQEQQAPVVAPQQARVTPAPTMPDYSGMMEKRMSELYTDYERLITQLHQESRYELVGGKYVQDIQAGGKPFASKRELVGEIQTLSSQLPRPVQPEANVIGEARFPTASQTPPPEAPRQAGQQITATTGGTVTNRTEVTVNMPIEFSQRIADSLKDAVMEMLRGTLTPIVGQLGDVQAMVRRIAKSDSHMGGGG